jgi:hypothetical protein
MIIDVDVGRYIQWLFPIFESKGMNYNSAPLSKAEAKLIREDLDCAQRVLTSYKVISHIACCLHCLPTDWHLQLMLNFYGLKLVDEQTGEVARDEKNWKDRYQNLNTSSHNNLRISRIIASLGHLGTHKAFLTNNLYHNGSYHN